MEDLQVSPLILVKLGGFVEGLKYSMCIFFFLLTIKLVEEVGSALENCRLSAVTSEQSVTQHDFVNAQNIQKYFESHLQV